LAFGLDPATNEELGTVPEMGMEETKEAIEAASRAFASWSRTTAKVCPPFVPADLLAIDHGSKHRHDTLMRLFHLMKQHHDDLGRLIVSIERSL
jgi:succinate-semialdehyde dehydrogenase/glutarate-semialdehyde dehydrogenase